MGGSTEEFARGQVGELGAETANGGGAEALVTASFGGRQLSWRGRLVRVGAELDPRTRMARLVVQVDEPYADESAPLMVGAFVEKFGG